MRRKATQQLVTTVISLVVAAALGLLTSLVSPGWSRRWWWAIAVVLVAAVLVPIYLTSRKAAKVRRIAVASDRAGTLHLLAVTADGRVRLRTFKQDRSWSEWSGLDFPQEDAWDVAAVVPVEGGLEVYVADQSGTVWSRARRKGGRWTDWTSMVGDDRIGAVTALDAMSGWPGHREIYVVGENGKVGHRWQWDGHPWSSWGSAHRGDARDVALSVPAKDQLEVFVLDRGGALWHRWYLDGRWSDWGSLEQPEDRSESIAISALNGPERHQEVYVVGASGDVAHRWHWQGEKWDVWHGMPSPDHLVDIAAGATTIGRYEVIGVGETGTLWRRSYDSRASWSTWQRVP